VVKLFYARGSHFDLSPPSRLLYRTKSTNVNNISLQSEIPNYMFVAYRPTYSCEVVEMELICCAVKTQYLVRDCYINKEDVRQQTGCRPFKGVVTIQRYPYGTLMRNLTGECCACNTEMCNVENFTVNSERTYGDNGLAAVHHMNLVINVVVGVFHWLVNI
jgi:hypothetical protein